MSIQIEMRVLSSLINNGNPNELVIQQAMLQLVTHCFANHDNQLIFNIIKNHYNLNKQFDVLVIETSIPTNLFGLFLDLCGQYGTLNTLLSDCELLLDYMRKRQIIRGLDILRNEVLNENIPSESIKLAIEECLNMTKIFTKSNCNLTNSEELGKKVLLGEIIDDVIIPSGIKTIDNVNGGGFKLKSLITIAGRPSTGKTNFSIYLAHNIALNAENKHVLFFSLEMTAEQIYKQQMACVMGKHYEQMNKEEKIIAVKKSSEVHMSIDSTPQASIDYIQTASRILYSQRPFSIIVVDYLGCVTNNGNFESNTLKLADVAAKLTALAKELSCIVIILSQVNRDYTKREDKSPITSDAADTISTERHSAYWLGIYRPEMDKPEDITVRNQFTIVCRKNRWVDKLWTINLDFNQATFAETNPNKYSNFIPEAKGVKNYYKSCDENLNDLIGHI